MINTHVVIPTDLRQILLGVSDAGIKLSTFCRNNGGNCYICFREGFIQAVYQKMSQVEKDTDDCIVIHTKLKNTSRVGCIGVRLPT